MRKIQKILIGIFACGVLMGGVGTGIAFVEFSSFAYAGEKKVGEEHLVTREFDQSFDPARGKVDVEVGWNWRRTGESTVVADPSVPEGVVRYEVTYNEKTVRPYVYYDEYDDEDPEDLETVEESWEEEPEQEEYVDAREDADTPGDSDSLGNTDTPGDSDSLGNTDTPGDSDSSGSADTPGDSDSLGDADIPGDGGSSGDTDIPENIDAPEGADQSGDSQDRFQGRILLGFRYIGSDFALWMECKDDFLQELKQKRISYYELVNLEEVKVRVNPATLPYVENQIDW